MHVHITQPTWIYELGFAGLHAIRCVNMAMAIVAYGPSYRAFLHFYSLERRANC